MGKGPVVINLLKIASGQVGVTLAEFTAGNETARHCGWLLGHGQVWQLVLWWHPVVQDVTQVCQGVTQGAEFPVQYGLHLAITNNHVAEAIVAVNYAGANLLWHGFSEDAARFLHGRNFMGF